MKSDWETVSRQLRELAAKAKAEDRLIDVEEFAEIIGLNDAESSTPGESTATTEGDLTVSSGQLRAVMKELHDRDVSEILLVDLLDRLRVGPLQRPASEYVDFPVTGEGIHVLSMFDQRRRPTIGPIEWSAEWITYSPLLDHGIVQRAWARTFCRLGVHLFDQVFSLERGTRLYCDACGCEVELRRDESAQ